MAIGESPAKKLKLCQIYDWIKEKFPYYRVSDEHKAKTGMFTLIVAE